MACEAKLPAPARGEWKWKKASMNGSLDVLQRQSDPRKLAFCVVGGFQVFLRCLEGLVAEPGLHGANIDASTQPSRSGGVPEAV